MNAVTATLAITTTALTLACSSSPAPNKASPMDAKMMTRNHQEMTPMNSHTKLSLQKGQILTVAVSRHREGAEDKMQAYFQEVMPIAKPLGFSQLGALNVIEANAGSFEPNNFVGFYAFPSADAASTFAADARWPAIKATRPDIWSELRISHFHVEAAKNVTLRDDRIYEVRYEFVSANDSPSLEAKGATTLLDLVEGSHEMTPSSLAAPMRIRLLEWESLAVATSATRPLASGRVDSLYTKP